ncbi:hypothetical protein [Haliangium sp.]|uniref:hypothetical protein n=1 Tax=Haliangium sp. TaxID=2663208 RepID=UPI003D12C23C
MRHRHGPLHDPLHNKEPLLAALGYTVATFIVAVTWHLGLFREFYSSTGYIEGEPSIALGFVTIALQGLILSYLYGYIRARMAFRPLTYAAVLGSFHWTLHVLAFVAKQEVSRVWAFTTMETLYLAIQFGLYGLVLRAVYRGRHEVVQA